MSDFFFFESTSGLLFFVFFFWDGICWDENTLRGTFSIVVAFELQVSFNAAFASHRIVSFIILIFIFLLGDKDINEMCFMHSQEAANVFKNFTINYRNITSGKDKPGEDEFRTESIFRVAVAFEKFALSYGKHYLTGTRRSERIDLHHMCEYELDRFRFVIIDHKLSNWMIEWPRDRLIFSLTFREIEWLTDLLTDNLTEWI